MTRKGSQIRVLLLPPFRKTSKSLAWMFFCGSQNRLFEAKRKKSQFAKLPPFRKTSKSLAWMFFCGSKNRLFEAKPKKSQFAKFPPFEQLHIQQVATLHNST